MYCFVIEDEKKIPIKTRPETLQPPKSEPMPQESSTVQVPDMDIANEFFTPKATQESIEVTSDDFDHLYIYSADV